MRGWICVVGLLVGLVCCGPVEPVEVDVVSWNLHFFPGQTKQPSAAEEAEHLAAAREAVRGLGADVLCLLEIKTREGAEALVSVLPGFSVRVCSEFPELYGAPLQIVIASRLEPVAEGWMAFEKTEADPPFGMVYAVFECGGEHLLVAGVHLQANVGGIEKSTPGREDGARQILGLLAGIEAELAERGIERISTLICGDYNMDPGGGRWEADGTDEIFREAGYAWGFEGVPFEDRVTWLSNGRFPDASFDHVFYKMSGDTAIDVEWVVLEGPPSDHLPVRARVGR